MYFYVTVDDTTQFTFKINGSSVDYDSYENNVYCVSVDIPAKDMLTGEYTLTIVSEDESEYTVTYSILQYIAYTLSLEYDEDAIKKTDGYLSCTTDSQRYDYLVIAKDEFDDLQNLCKALYCYAYEADAYWNS